MFECYTFREIEAVGKFKWSNIPIPEGHVITLVAGIALHVWRPLEFWQSVLERQISGWTFLMIGILLALWGAMTFKDMDFEKPIAIVTAGPYAFSRNPMYLAWTLIYLAFVLLVNTWWLIILLPALLFFMHFHDVRQEERQLEEKFGEEYRQYRARVRRYL